MKSKQYHKKDIFRALKHVDEKEIDRLLNKKLKKLNKKIVVLDDDPTGVQTVHDISVYTDWNKETIRKGFREDKNIFFILTNSRSFSYEKTRKVHQEIGINIANVSKEEDIDFIIISRGDSTLRGHYPIETETLKKALEKNLDKIYDGEIIYPFFKEGGRYTLNNIHYVQYEDKLISVGDTEFAKDKSFGYKSSTVTDWCEEKTEGKYKAKDMVTISLEGIRNLELNDVTAKLMNVERFNKVIVNSIDYMDVKIFTIAFIDAMLAGKEFIIRSSASFVKILGGISDKPLLTKKELSVENNNNNNGGIVIVGSHVQKTTRQLEELQNSGNNIKYIKFDVNSVFKEDGIDDEIKKALDSAEYHIKQGVSVVVYTSRDIIKIDTNDKDKILKTSVKISDALTSIIGKLSIRPKFIIAKGGITSSDVGIKGLRVKKATVLGQIKPGIPVWKTGEESTFPNMSYVIFPGNVGNDDTLKEVVEILI